MGQHLVDTHLSDPYESFPHEQPTRGVTTRLQLPPSMWEPGENDGEAFSDGAIVLATALKTRHRVVIAANLHHQDSGATELSGWECTHDDLGVDLTPISIETLSTGTRGRVETGAIQLVGKGGRGDALVVCDPFGDNELLLWALRVASPLGMTTIAITTDQPNLLAALANHAVRVPVGSANRQEHVVSALRRLVQTAGISLVPARQRGTARLRSVHFTAEPAQPAPG